MVSTINTQTQKDNSPNQKAIPAFLIASAIYVPFTLPLIENMAGVQGIVGLFGIPVLIFILIDSYFVGKRLAILNKESRGKSFVPFLELLAMIVTLAVVCTVLEITFVGEPIKMCWATCQEVPTIKAGLDYLLVLLVASIPAWFGIALNQKTKKK